MNPPPVLQLLGGDKKKKTLGPGFARRNTPGRVPIH